MKEALSGFDRYCKERRLPTINLGAVARLDPEQRFFAKVRFVDRWYDNGKVNTRCLEWTGCKTTTPGSAGYGRFSPGYVDGKQKWVLPHRWLYERWIGPIPEGLTLDHECRNRACVNPSHCKPVTQLENARRAAEARRNGDFGAPIKLISTALREARTHCPRKHDLRITENQWWQKGRKTPGCQLCRVISYTASNNRRAAATSRRPARK